MSLDLTHRNLPHSLLFLAYELDTYRVAIRTGLSCSCVTRIHPYIWVIIQVTIDAVSASTYIVQDKISVTIEYSIALVMVLALVSIWVFTLSCRDASLWSGLSISPLVSTRWLPVLLP